MTNEAVVWFILSLYTEAERPLPGRSEDDDNDRPSDSRNTPAAALLLRADKVKPKDDNDRPSDS